MTQASAVAVPLQSVKDWASCADVIVVGCGMAGICAAIEARELGASVTILERAGTCAGSTTVAAGHFYLGGGTAVQKACGFADDAANLQAYLSAVSSMPDHAKIAAFAAGAVAHFDWLESRGVPFDRSYYPHKAVVQPGRECLIWTGNERVWPFRDLARPAPRGHKVACEGADSGGRLALTRLVQHASSIGVQVVFDARVDALVTDQGKVIGVGAQVAGRLCHMRAMCGVILAAGGFSQNKEMMATYLARFSGINLMSGAFDDGVAISLGRSVGAAVAHMSGCLITSPIYPPESLVHGILVNGYGRRFVSEDSYHTRTSVEIADQPGGVAYLIVDAANFAYPEWSKQANQCLVDGYSTVEEMEAGLKLPTQSLSSTMARYNADATARKDTQFGKHPDWLKSLENGPWAAFDFSFGRAIYNGFTLGGLQTSDRGEVLNCDGVAIAGLYAAGACTSMLSHDSRDYASGISLSGASFFGRAAGRQAATDRSHQRAGMA